MRRWAFGDRMLNESTARISVWPWRHVHRNADYLFAAAQRYAFHRRYVGIVAAPRHCKMLAARHDIVGRIEILPTEHGAPGRDPGVRGPLTHEVSAGAQIAAHVARGQFERPQARDHQVRKILAHAAAGFQHFIHGRSDGGGAAIVVELSEDTPREIFDRAQEWTAGGEGGGGVLSKRRAHPDGR